MECMMFEIEFNEKISSFPKDFFSLNNRNGENTETASKKIIQSFNGDRYYPIKHAYRTQDNLIGQRFFSI